MGKGSGEKAQAVLAVLGAALVLSLGIPGQALAATPTPSPAWELTSNHGPTNVPTKPPANLVMILTVRAHDGKFTLYFENEETGEEGETKLLPFDATAAEVQEALEKLKEGGKAIGPGNVVVTGGPGDATGSKPYVIEFTGALADRYLGSEVLAIGEQELTEAEEKKLEKNGEEPEEGTFSLAIATAGYHGTVDYQLTPRNIGGETAKGPITIADQLPAGLATKAAPEGEGWTCEVGSKAQQHYDKEAKLPEGAGLTSVKCTTEAPVNPDADAKPIEMEANVDVSAVHEGEQLSNHAKVSGGNAASMEAEPDVATVSSTPAPFGVHGFTAATFGPAGETYTQAGGHPYAATTSFFFNTVPTYNAAEKVDEVLPAGNVKDVDVKLPTGFIGNPMAAARCSQAEFTSGLKGGSKSGFGACPAESQVGEAEVYFHEFGSTPEPVAVYDLAPPTGVPAEFGFIFNHVPIRLDAHLVREAGEHGEYRVTVLSADINEIYGIFGVTLSLWGVPGESSHDPERFKSLFERGTPDKEGERSFLTNPTDCLAEASVPPETTIYADSWQQPGRLDAQGDPVAPGPNWQETEAGSPPVTDCQDLTFEPAISFEPTLMPNGTTQADEPSGYTFKLDVPQNENPKGLATPELKDTTVTLPEDVSISPSAANGLEACAEKPGEPGEPSIEPESTEPGSCPPASQIGTVKIVSPLLEVPLEGRVYIGKPECSPCTSQDAEDGKLFRLFIEAEGSGVRIKLPGRTSANVATGQLTATFENNPQLPVETLELTLKNGPRAPLANPQSCGSLTTTADMTPWSLAGGGVLGTPEATPTYTSPTPVSFDGLGGLCPGSLPFGPAFHAGAENSTGGAYNSFEAIFERHDREQDLSGITVRMPPGLLGRIAGVTRCPQPQAASGGCPESSRIGTATADAGAGSDPYAVSGPVYLTDGYKSGPFGLSVVIPAKAGPFYLGDVIVRAAINVDPTTAALTITSDPLPQSRDGVPFRLQRVSVRVDRKNFMLNPTNCEAKTIGATISGGGGASVQPSVPFTASSCASLPFKPEFTVRTQAKTSKASGASLFVKVVEPAGSANIRKVQLQLPLALPSRLSTLQKACTEAQFNANPAGCPEASNVGTARAITPLLNVPLEGPAYLVSHGGAAFPDLEFLLQGEGVHITLDGGTDIKKGITYSKFETVPDAPISTFETNLPQGPHSILTANGSLCGQSLIAPTTIVAQNNAQVIQQTRIAVSGCTPAKPSVTIAKTKVKGNELLVTVKTSQTGAVKISGVGLKSTVKRGLKAGARRIGVPFTKAGRTAKSHHRKIKLRVSLTVGTQSATRTATVKA
jgi:hypothetical protein